MKKALLILLMVLAVILPGCKKQEEIEYYSYETPATEPAEEVQETPSETKNFDFASVIRYEVNDRIAEVLNQEKFDAELTAVLQEAGKIPTKGTRVVTATDGGYISYYFDGHYEFELSLNTGDGTLIRCMVDGEQYSFAIY